MVSFQARGISDILQTGIQHLRFSYNLRGNINNIIPEENVPGYLACYHHQVHDLQVSVHLGLLTDSFFGLSSGS